VRLREERPLALLQTADIWARLQMSGCLWTSPLRTRDVAAQHEGV